MEEPQRRKRSKRGKRNQARSFENTQLKGLLDEDEYAPWGEVCRACWVHSPSECAVILTCLVLCLILLYFFLVGLELLGSGAKVMTGCAAGALFGDDQNPVTAVMVGILGTVLQQSSSTTTTVTVSLVGAEVMTVQTGIYVVMGANIGTTITNTIVSLAQFGNTDQFQRAFSGAVLHDIFNLLTAAVLFPLELVTGYLYYLTKALVRGADTENGESWEGPVKLLVTPLADKILISNRKVITSVASGGSCDEIYPIYCEPDMEPTYTTCTRTGLITCSKHTGDCPAFFRSDATQAEDQMSGFVVFLIGLFIVFFCIFSFCSVLTRLLTGVSTRIIYTATNMNGYLAIATGAGLTMLLQSSSTFVSILTPLVGLGVLRLEQMYPLTLGANIGTTLTALLAAMVTDGTEGLQVALAHLFFNVTGVMIWYPIPVLADVPLRIARQLGRIVKLWKGFAFVYIISVFFVTPIFILLLSELFTTKEQGYVVLASFLTVIAGVAFFYFVYWWYFKEGQDLFFEMLENRKTQLGAMESLPYEMKYIDMMMQRLAEYSALPVDAFDNTDQAAEQEPALTGLQQWQKRQGGLNNLKLDLQFLRTKIDDLVAYVALPDIQNEEEPDAIGLVVKVPSADGDEALPLESVAFPSVYGFSKVWGAMPTYYKVLFGVIIPLYCWGIIALFIHESHSTTALGIFFLVTTGLFVGKFLHYWFYEKGDEKMYHHWVDTSRRMELLANLSEEIAIRKLRIQKLSIHVGMSGKDIEELTANGS